MIQAAAKKRRPAKEPVRPVQSAKETKPDSPQVDISEPLLTTEEAAAILQMQPLTLVRWRHARRGPKFFKVGGSVRYRKVDLEQWLAGQQVDTEQSLV